MELQLTYSTFGTGRESMELLVGFNAGVDRLCQNIGEWHNHFNFLGRFKRVVVVSLVSLPITNACMSRWPKYDFRCMLEKSHTGRKKSNE